MFSGPMHCNYRESKGGGGRPDLAQAGSADGARADAALDAIAALIAAGGGTAASGQAAAKQRAGHA